MLNKSLLSRHDKLASASEQRRILELDHAFPSFSQRLNDIGLAPLKPTGIRIFQINIGKMCNQVCAHCHVDAGPDRKEIMTRDTMQQCLDVLMQSQFDAVDITGGAPEMNPDFRWFVGQVSALGFHVIIRCNLTIIVANRKFHDLPDFYRNHKVEVISSLPFYSADRTDRQRGQGVFKDSITALQMLNETGYGKPGSELILNLVYNPAGAFMPGNQSQLEKDFKKELKQHFNIDFNNLYCITNMPISRYLEYLIKTGNYEKYMDRLVSSFNPSAAAGVMCRNTISVSWDGYLYDCDFNQMLDLKVSTPSRHITDFDLPQLNNREIVVNQHCYGCTAGAGSTCGGATT